MFGIVKSKVKVFVSGHKNIPKITNQQPYKGNKKLISFNLQNMFVAFFSPKLFQFIELEVLNLVTFFL